MDSTSEVHSNYISKCILIGDSCVGKTSLLRQACESKFANNEIPTVGIDFGSLRYKMADDMILKSQIWDCAGQERFRSIVRSYFRGANIVFLVFDKTNYQTFTNLENWYNTVINNTKRNESFVFFVIGNKCDLTTYNPYDNSVNVDEKDAQKFADSIGGTYFETSAKTGKNVKEIFKIANKKLYDLYLEGKIDLQKSIYSDGLKSNIIDDSNESGCCIIS